VEGINDFSKQHYMEPCLPGELQRYFFKVNGLNRLLDLPDTTGKFALEKSVTDCITGFGEMIGFY